ncbi:centrosomal protein of 57 kDa isoform 2-T2 [Polymixia lowei]
METLLSKPPAVHAAREKEQSPALPRAVMSDSLSLPSYKEYPARHPFINTLADHKPQTCTYQASRLSSPSKAFPETSSAEIFSALRNLQEKIRSLELEKGRAEFSIRTVGTDTSHTQLQSEKVMQRLSNTHTQRDTARETSDHPHCNQALITQLAAAESRCVQLERQLDHMRRMARYAKADRTSLLKRQVSMATARSADQALDSVSGHAQLEKLERLEQEYLRLTRTQNNAERKIHELEMKLQEEEHQRKLVQDKANLTGLEANRILLQSVSPRPPRRQSKEKRSSSKKPLQQQPSLTQPHYRLSLGDVPFVTGKSVGCSHSVRANVQSVLSLLKQHQPQLCNSRVLSQAANRSRSGSSSSSSSSSSTGGEELSELVQALQEELRLMSLEQDELMRQVEASVSEHERKELQREQERLLLKMERKGEQISKLYKHKTQMKKLRKEASGNHRRRGKSQVRVTTTVTTRGRSAGLVKLGPGERSKRNLMLLRDMKALQTSLQT